MVEMTLPSGVVLDFEDATDDQIQSGLSALKQQQPELFEDAQPDPQANAPDLGTASYDELKQYYQKEGASTKDVPEFTPTHEGEVDNLPFQYNYGKADNDAGRRMRLEREFGPGNFERDPSGNFYLLLDNIDPEKKKEFNLPEEGTIFVNRPGGDILNLFDTSDIVSGVGAYQGPLLGSLAASFASTGFGLPVAAVLMGVGAAGGKAYDEFIQENNEGMQDQTDDQIYGDIATEGLFGFGGELIIGGAIRGIRRLVKGSGKPDPKRIEELNKIKGVPEKLAKKLAAQQSRAGIRGTIQAGARPTLYEATGKPLSGRVQAIYEGIFPNAKAALNNTEYITKITDKFIRGDINSVAFKNSLEENSQNIIRSIKDTMVDPEKAVEVANRHLRETIEKEIDLLKDQFATGSKQAKEWQKAMGQTVRLWQQDSSYLYKNAEDLIGDAAQFDSRVVKDEVLKILGLKRNPKTGETTPISQNAEELAEVTGLADKPLFKYIQNKEGDFTLTELNALRHTLRAQGKSPDLVGTASDFQIKKIADSLDEMLAQKASSLAEMSQATVKSGARKGKPVINPSTGQPIFGPEQASVREGLEKLFEANKHYTDGAEVFKSGVANMLNKNVKDGYFNDLLDIVEATVKNRKPEALKRHLSEVTPSSAQLGAIQKIAPETWQSAAKAARDGDIDLLIAKLQTVDESVIGKPQPWLMNLAKDDPYRKRILSQMAETLEQYADDAVARGGNAVRRNVNRDMLASTWFQNAVKTSESGRVINPGQLAQKFDDLGEEVQTILFGKAESDRIRTGLNDYFLVGKKSNELTETLLADIVNPKIRNIVGTLKQNLNIATQQSEDALRTAIRSGTITDADELIIGAIKNPRLVDSLKANVSEEVLEAPGGLKDMAMQRIMLQAFPEGVTSEAVSSGAFSTGLVSAIKKMNSQGGLTKILGADKVKELRQVAANAERISNLALKGKTGLAPAAFAAGFGLRLVTAPAAALSEAAGILLMGRVLRNKTFLNWMTKPQIRAKDAKKGIKVFTDEILRNAERDGVSITRKEAAAQAKKQLGLSGGPGETTVGSLRLKEMIARETRAIMTLEASQGLDTENRQAIAGAASTGMDTVNQAVGQVVPQLQLQQPPPPPPPPPVQGPPPMAPQPPVRDVLRDIEMNKLFGVSP